MTNYTTLNVSARTALAVLVVSVLAIASVPAFASASNYAYVNHSGEVRMVTSDTPMNAIATAPGISLHSGVLLLSNTSSDNGVVGDNVLGM